MFQTADQLIYPPTFTVQCGTATMKVDHVPNEKPGFHIFLYAYPRVCETPSRICLPQISQFSMFFPIHKPS